MQHHHRQQQQQARSSTTPTSEHRNVAFELGGPNSSGSFSSSSARATTSPRAPLEWSGAAGGSRAGTANEFDSGYQSNQTDSPLMAAAATTGAPTTATANSTAIFQPDDQAEQFNMSLEDVRPSASSQPPPGTFRPVSPQPVMRHAATQTRFRPASVPTMADLPDDEDEMLMAVEVAVSIAGETAATRRHWHAQAGEPELAAMALPDLLLETGGAAVDVRLRSQSVPAFPDEEERQRLMRHHQLPVDERITAVAMGLRRIGDEISSSRVARIVVMQRTRGYSLSYGDRHPTDSAAAASAVVPTRRRRSLSFRASSAAAAAAASSSSYPGESAHHRRGASAASAAASAAWPPANNSGSSDSWLERLSRMFRTLSGADIATEEDDEEEDDDEEAEEAEEAEEHEAGENATHGMRTDEADRP